MLQPPVFSVEMFGIIIAAGVSGILFWVVINEKVSMTWLQE